MIFGMIMGLGYGMLIFGKSGSKVKGQGQKSTVFFGPILGTEVKYGSDQNQGGSDGVPLTVCQLILATCHINISSIKARWLNH